MSVSLRAGEQRDVSKLSGATLTAGRVSQADGILEDISARMSSVALAGRAEHTDSISVGRSISSSSESIRKALDNHPV